MQGVGDVGMVYLSVRTKPRSGSINATKIVYQGHGGMLEYGCGKDSIFVCICKDEQSKIKAV